MIVDDVLTVPPASGSEVTPMRQSRVLLVEDDSEIGRMLCDVLVENGFQAKLASTPDAMDAYLGEEHTDLIILDIMLPGEDGLSICRRLRATSNIPVIILTARNEEVDRIVGLEVGADDYVTKPFSSRELVARVRALLRRARGSYPRSRDLSGTCSFAGWRLEPASRQLFNPDGVRISLTSAEFDLLLAFCQHPGQVLSRDQLLELTHNGMAGPIVRSIDVHVSRIRKKIEPDSEDATIIKTVRLGGYIFTPSVRMS